MALFKSALVAAALVLPAATPAQEVFPAKPIRFISCCQGYTEVTARLIAAEIQERYKQAVVVETKPGANGIIATDFVAKSTADGYTVLIGTNSTHAANQSLYAKLPYDYIKDFTPVSGISQGMLLWVVDANLPAKTAAEVTAMAKKEPGKLTFGAASSSARAGMELYKMISGADITYVPYKTNPQVVTDILGGRVDMMFNDAGSLLPHVQSGRLRAMAVSGTARSAALPDVPTMQEAGVPGYALTFWHGAWVPAGTPKDVVGKVGEMFRHALATPKVRDHITNALATPMPLGSEELLKFTMDEEQKWRKIAVGAQMKAE